MSGALAVGGSVGCVVPHPTTSTAAIVVIRRCFIFLVLLIIQISGHLVFAMDSVR